MQSSLPSMRRAVSWCGQVPQHCPLRLEQDRGIRLAVRVGVHTGPVVVGAMGSGGRQEHLAMGDTPNLAARLQGLAAPNTVLVSATTWRLIEGFFTCQTLGEHALKGL